MFYCLAPFSLSSTPLHTTRTHGKYKLSHIACIYIYISLIHTKPLYHFDLVRVAFLPFSVSHNTALTYSNVYFVFRSYSVLSVNNTTYHLFGLGLPLFQLLSLHHSACMFHIDRFHVMSLPPCWRTTTKDSSLAFIFSSSNMAATSLLFEPAGLDCKPSIVLHVCCYLTEMSLYDPETMLTSRYLSEFVCKFIEAVEEPTERVEVLKKVCFMAYINFCSLRLRLPSPLPPSLTST